MGKKCHSIITYIVKGEKNMNYMDLYNACDCRANKGLEELMNFVFFETKAS